MPARLTIRRAGTGTGAIYVALEGVWVCIWGEDVDLDKSLFREWRGAFSLGFVIAAVRGVSCGMR